MEFEIDDQASADLGLFPGRRDGASIFNYYDQTQTKGGKETLLGIFKLPSNDLAVLHRRQGGIQFFADNDDLDIHFEFR